MNTEISEWINEAARETRIQADRLDSRQAQSVYENARTRYVSGNPRAWWMSLKCNAEILHTRNAVLTLLHLSADEMCYLIPETEGDPCVFRLKFNEVGTLLDNCPFFEYYVAAIDFGWLIIESDHNEFFVVRSD